MRPGGASGIAALDTALERLQRLRELQASLTEEIGVSAARELSDIAQRIIRIVGASTNGTGAAVGENPQLFGIIQQLDDLIARANGTQTFRNGYRQMGRLTLNEVPQVYAAFGRTTEQQLISARDAFTTEARKQFNAGFAKWADSFQNNARVLKQSMQRTMIEAQLGGWNQRQLAQRLLEIPEFQFSNLPKIGARGERIFSMGGTLNPSEALIRRAHVVARTEMNAVQNRMHETWTQEAGFTNYINVNSDPVADVCIEANSRGAMTLEEWDRTLGRPPRHPNCDSVLMAVNR